MADEQTPAADAPQQEPVIEAESEATGAEATPAEDAQSPEPVAEVAGEEPAPVEDAQPEEPVAEAAQDAQPDEPAAEAEVAGDAAPSEPAAPPAPPQEILHPKERRRRTRQRAVSVAAGPRDPQERQAQRDALRAKAGKARAERRRQERAEKPAAASTQPVEQEPRAAGRQKTRQGIVVSDKAQKTITVRVDISRRHRRYSKIVRSSKTLHAHDENNDAHEGDLVRVIETRPLSATKRWRLAEVLERAK
ncbi:MAG: 30S ribosomal protein S17 [Solirubrobacteraceae bacterium]|jgi:small subunit ribosomal protein S17